MTTQSDNSAIEYKRQDIIKSLVSGGWYKNLAMDLETPLKDELTNEQTTKLVEFLSGLFLRTDGSNEYLADILNFANGGDIINAGNIVAIDDGFEKTITGYKFEPNADSVINKANMIYDPADAEYKFIDKVDKIAFFGKDLNKALTRQETYNLLSASNTLWNAAYSYEEDVAVLYTFTKAGKEFIGQAISLIDNNTGHNPADGGVFWKVFESTGTADITEIVDKVVEQVEPIIDEKFEVLPTIDYVSEYANQTISFDTEADFEAFKTETGTDDTFYEDVAGGGTGTGDVTLDTDQTITGEKTFSNKLTLNKNLNFEIAGSNASFIDWYKDGTRIAYLGKGSSSNNTITLSAETNDLILNAANIKVGDKRIQQVGTPTANTDAANKKYVDDNVLLKQNKLTAGTNIDITDNVISATGGGGGSSVVSVDSGEIKELPLIISGSKVYVRFLEFKFMSAEAGHIIDFNFPNLNQKYLRYSILERPRIGSTCDNIVAKAAYSGGSQVRLFFTAKYEHTYYITVEAA